MPSRTLEHRIAGMFLCALAAVSPLTAQSAVGWLRYAIPPDPPRYHSLPHAVVLLGNGTGQAAPEELTAAEELDRGLGHMVAGTDVVLHHFDPRIDAIVLGTTEALHRARLGRYLPGWTEKPVPEEGFRMVHLRRGIREWYILQGGSPRAELWAAFRFAALVAEDQQLPEDFTDAPHLPLRAIDLGDADALPLLEGPAPHTGLLRLLASVGINGLFLDAPARQVARVAGLVRPYGMRVWIRGNEDSPEGLARLAAMPNFGGIIVTTGAADTPGQLRITAQAANTQARVLRRPGATVLLENALGSPLQAPLASAQGFQNFSPEEHANILSGSPLESNVMLMGAGSVEPLSGLGSANFGLMPGTPQVATFPVLARRPDTLAYPAPAWASALQTPERGLHGSTFLSTLLSAADGSGARGGLVGKMSGDDAFHMLRQPLLLANLYAFSRLAWSPVLKAEAITDEWSRQTWGDDARLHGVATQILLESSAASVENSTPLGLPLMASLTGSPDPAAATRLFVGNMPLAGSGRLGIDRTAQGTDEVARYPPDFSAVLADPSRCPLPWLLLFHNLPYTATLPNGKTVAQSFYDAHFAGAAQMGNAVDAWESTRTLLDAPRFQAVESFLARAAVHAEIWRETTTEWMQQTSGVRDTFGFVGSHTGRVRAADMELSGYTPGAGTPSFPAGSRVVCGQGECTAATVFKGGENVYRIEAGYEDEHLGCVFQVLVNGEVRARWQTSSTALPLEPERFIVNGVRLKQGDTIALQATASNGAAAPLNFVEITRDPRWN